MTLNVKVNIDMAPIVRNDGNTNGVGRTENMVLLRYLADNELSLVAGGWSLIAYGSARTSVRDSHDRYA